MYLTPSSADKLRFLPHPYLLPRFYGGIIIWNCFKKESLFTINIIQYSHFQYCPVLVDLDTYCPVWTLPPSRDDQSAWLCFSTEFCAYLLSLPLSPLCFTWTWLWLKPWSFAEVFLMLFWVPPVWYRHESGPVGFLR